MKKNLLMLLWGACLLTACSGQPIGENASVTTYVYAEKDGSELKLDVYMDSTALISNTKYPVFIFSLVVVGKMASVRMGLHYSMILLIMAT